jgi:hypothetical protein
VWKLVRVHNCTFLSQKDVHRDPYLFSCPFKFVAKSIKFGEKHIFFPQFPQFCPSDLVKNITEMTPSHLARLRIAGCKISESIKIPVIKEVI